MKGALLGVLVALLATANAEHFNTYDAAAVERFDNELRSLGVTLKSLTKPEEQITPPAPIVFCAAGDFEGYWTESQFGRPIAAFEGIPYALPPIGSLRFKVAQPSPRLSNFKAKKPGSKCLQRDLFLSIPGVSGSEDCLYMNVYVPETVKREAPGRLPVLFYVHGGGYVYGQSDIFQSNLLLDKDVVLVTFNYRLGALGFLSTGDDVIPGNLGLRDQVAALRWVHENIASFGGDPDRVTVFGHSAGGSSTVFLMMSPLTKGLIHRVIAMSGSAFAHWAFAEQREIAENKKRAAQILGCPGEPSEELLSCLRTKSAEEITEMEFHFRVPGWSRTPIVPFPPVIEGDIPEALIPHHPVKLLAEGLANDVPFMTGVTSEEGMLFSSVMNDGDLHAITENFSEFSASAFFPNQPEVMKHLDSFRRAYLSPGPLSRTNTRELANMYSDIYFIRPALKFAQYHKENAKAPLYFYYFSSVGSRSLLQYDGVNISDGNYGVSHGDDLFYLFDLPMSSKPSPKDVLTSIILTDIYASFARDGSPSSMYLNTEWKPVTTQGNAIEFLHFKSSLEITMQNDFIPERQALLQKLLDSDDTHDEL